MNLDDVLRTIFKAVEKAGKTLVYREVESIPVDSMMGVAYMHWFWQLYMFLQKHF